MIGPLGPVPPPDPEGHLVGLEGLWIANGSVYSNLVTSADGIVAVEGQPPSFISRRSDQDRSMMGALRAFASAIVIGAGTLRAEPDHIWEPSFVAPAWAGRFSALRQHLGLPPSPLLVVLTNSGDLPSARALAEAAVATPAGVEINAKVQPSAVMEAPSDSTVPPQWLIDQLRAEGHSRILVEGGPRLLGRFVEERCIDEMFLTISPILLGSGGHNDTLLEGMDLSKNPPLLSLVESRRAGSHLFLRYAVT